MAQTLVDLEHAGKIIGYVVMGVVAIAGFAGGVWSAFRAVRIRDLQTQVTGLRLERDDARKDRDEAREEIKRLEDLLITRTREADTRRQINDEDRRTIRSLQDDMERARKGA